MPRQVFASRRVVFPDRFAAARVVVADGKIAAIEDYSPTGVDHDFGDLCLLPGLVDTHVHINEPGRTEWEGFETATRAAAAGGYTTLVDMPLNCLPPTTNVAALMAKREAAEGKCRVDWAAWGGVVADNSADILPLAAAGVPGFKAFLIDPGCEGFTCVGQDEMRASMPLIAKSNLPLLVHAEIIQPITAALIELAGADWRRYSTYLASRPDTAELGAISLMLALGWEYGCRVHIVHVATAQALFLLQAAREHGFWVTSETCPHYLCFTAEEIPDGATEFKCAPPIRSAPNRERLWEGLRQGVINFVATDHSPCPPSMKHTWDGDFQKAWGGIASLSVALPAMWTEASARGFSLVDIVRWMASGPASLAGFENQKGSLAEGMDADFVVFDPDEVWTITANDLHFRHPVSPYVGREVRGKVKATYLRGTEIFKEGTFPGENLGRELRHGQ